MTITKNRLNKLESRLGLQREQVIVYFKNGLKSVFENKGVVVLPSEEEENIERIEGKSYIFVPQFIIDREAEKI